MDTPRFTLSADTRLLAQRLRSVAEGETITYRTLGEAIGGAVDGSTSSLHSARRILMRDHMVVFDVITGVGLKRLADRDIVATTGRMARDLRRAAERGVATLTCVKDFGALPRADQMRHTAVTATLCAIAQMTAEKALASIEAKVTPTMHELPISQTLAMFLSEKSAPGTE